MCGNVEISEPPAEVLPPEKSGDEKILAELHEICAAFNPGLMEVTETLAGGVYCRSGKFKAGEIVLGARHKKENFFYLHAGRLAVWDVFNGARILEAPYSEISLPGIQRVGIALTDCEGANLMATPANDVREAEAEMVEPLQIDSRSPEKIVALMRAAKLIA